MLLKEIFLKPVDRVIEGVIKADDLQALKTEIEEYVLTNEIASRLETFLASYNNYRDANGVWISGFFGSGKSHLLKMLSFLLVNGKIEGEETLEMFLPKCGDNALLAGEIKKAVKIPSQSILFNIDQKANVISKTETEALVAVFVKVFDEACGYFGNQPYIAQFERDLDQKELFADFKVKFKEVNSDHIKWEDGRSQSIMYDNEIDQAYNEVTQQKHSGVLDKYRQDYKLSIEDFANNVKSYLDTKEKNFRLNFFVDEVGQYIANNVKLMTNLQTVAESLATICEGRAWLIVTAQEEMDSIVGESGSLTKANSQSNDFSKIQGRFKTRMKLTSANVDEVIKKRLLAKNESAELMMNSLYDQHKLNFQTMFDFVDGSKRYKNYKDKDDFRDTYPFVPYQFTLFQEAIRNLSNHNAFEGRHNSVGERSMLGVFQVVAQQIGNMGTENLASFDLMFEGLRTSLKTGIQASISIAEQHLPNKFAIKLLKALFLVKYIKEFKSTIRNITVLMLNSLDQNIEELKNQIKEALNILEDQSYIQRNGDEYEFLTDDEKDVEQEIKNTEIDDNDLKAEFNKIIFDDILNKNKIRFPDTKQDYQYTRMLDSTQYGREYELSIHVITPRYEHYGSEETIIMHSMSKDELIVIMADDGRVMKDMLLYKQTQKYVVQNSNQSQSANRTHILVDKANQNREKKERLVETIKILLSQAKLFTNGSELTSSDALANTKIENGFYELIRRTYPYLKVCPKKYILADIQTIVSADEATYAISMALNEAQDEIFSFIKSSKVSGKRTSLKAIINKFEKKPYGWDYPAILCLVSELYKYEKVEARLNNEIISSKKLYFEFINSSQHDKIIINALVEFSKTQIKNLQSFYQDFFDEPSSDGEARNLANETKSRLKEYLAKINNCRDSSYPFAEIIEQATELFTEVQGKEYDWFLTSLDQAYSQKLLDRKIKITDPIIEFMQTDNPQRNIYDKAKRLINSDNSNLNYVDGADTQAIAEIINDPLCLQGSKIRNLNKLAENLANKIAVLVEKERNSSIVGIKALEEKLKDSDEYKKLTPEQTNSYHATFEHTLEAVKERDDIAVIRDKVRVFKDEEFAKIIRDIQIVTSPKPASQAKEEIAETFVSIRKIPINYNKFVIANDEDLASYLNSLKTEYEKVLKTGKKIEVR
ncbi:MAG: BREX system P-loop protein BrxC [Candidatus Cloacimonadales bacterium]